MRCHITGRDDETNPPAYNIWTSGTLQTPNILKSILNPTSTESNSSEDLHKFDSVSSSQKRKLLECEREDFEERFHKIQRKKQLQKVAARANLVVDDDDDDESDDEDRIYQQMDWIEKQSSLTGSSYDSSSSSSSSSSDDDDSLFDDKDSTSLFIPRSKWKEERRRLLRISMAKIHNVEDPEAYLRRSVLINNTVRRLQNDVPINYRCHSLSSSYFQGNVYQNDSLSSWDASVVCRPETDSDTFTFDYQYEALQNNHVDATSYPVGNNDIPCSLNFHLACASLSSDKITLEAIQRQVLQNGPAFYDRSSLQEQTLNDASLSLVLKQQSPLHAFSSQPCGLQYRNPIHTEENRVEYGESSSSILDSVVYRSLIASLET